jgi:AraC-like DNA-binding protein
MILYVDDFARRVCGSEHPTGHRAAPSVPGGAGLSTLLPALARIVGDPTSSWFVVVAGCKAIRHIVTGSGAAPNRSVQMVASLLLAAHPRRWEDVDARLTPLRPLLDSAPRDVALRTAAALACYLNMSERLLTKLVLCEFGISLPRLRIIARARPFMVDLLTTDEHVSQIAYARGYGHASQADHDLRRLLELPPKEFRRLCALGTPPAARTQSGRA